MLKHIWCANGTRVKEEVYIACSIYKQTCRISTKGELKCTKSLVISDINVYES